MLLGRYLQIVLSLICVVGACAKICKKHYYDITRHSNYEILPNDVCGENNGDRIIGGQVASLGEFPWMVRMGYKMENCAKDTEFRCGGALITEKVVITAAHCVINLRNGLCQPTEVNLSVASHSVRLGEHSSLTDPDCQQGVCAENVQDIEIEEAIPHPKYDNPIKLRHDIAIVKLKHPAVFNGWVNTLCLVPGDRANNERFFNHTGIVAGWGIINIVTKESSNELMMLKIPIVEFEKCVEAYSTRLGVNLSNTQQICAGGNKGQDSCSGDSGGPLFIIDDTETGPRYHILGVVSFGFKQCAAKPVPAIYTNILYYTKWIMDNLV